MPFIFNKKFIFTVLTLVKCGIIISNVSLLTIFLGGVFNAKTKAAWI